MANIEITTTQNVTVQHQLASVADRFLAAFVDIIVIVLIIVLLVAITDGLDTADSQDLILTLLLIPFVFFYTLVSESLLNGQTIGKKLVRIKSVRLDGRPMTFVDHFSRWSTRFVDIYLSATSLGMIMMMSTEKRQRLGGMISGTVVIKQSPRHKFSLQKIKNLEQYIDRDITHPEVAQLSETQMLSIKRLLDREKKYKTPVYTELLLQTSDKIKSDLQIQSETTPQKFLRQLLKDYVVLSR